MSMSKRQKHNSDNVAGINVGVACTPNEWGRRIDDRLMRKNPVPKARRPWSK
jgi:hypothetical protein